MQTIESQKYKLEYTENDNQWPSFAIRTEIPLDNAYEDKCLFERFSKWQTQGSICDCYTWRYCQWFTLQNHSKECVKQL